MLPYGRHWIDEDDKKAVFKGLGDDWLTQGPKIQEFEEMVSEYCGTKYGVAVSSGTAALHCAALAAGFSEGDEIITTSNTFVATANCIVYCNAVPVICDIKSDTYNIDPIEIEKRITKKTKGIIPVDFSGQPCDIVEIKKVRDKHNLIIIEDSAQALGAEYKDEDEKWHKVGSCSHSDMTVFSFHPVKHITTGEGGMVLTNNEELYKKLLMVRTHGVTKDRDCMHEYHGPWYFEMQMLGFNYRITDFQCALGMSQFKKLDRFVERRREIASYYNNIFKDVEEIVIPYEKPNMKSSYHLYVIQVREDKLNVTKREIFEELRACGIGVNVHHIPVHIHPFYRKRFGYKEGDFQVSEMYYKRAVSLPIYPGLSDDDMKFVVDTVKNVINRYKKG